MAAVVATKSAPSATALSTATPTSPTLEDLASTSRTWQFGQTAETASRAWAVAAGVPAPPALRSTFLKQPLPEVQAGRLYVVR